VAAGGGPSAPVPGTGTTGPPAAGAASTAGTAGTAPRAVGADGATGPERRPALEVRGLTKEFRRGNQVVRALADVDLTVHDGEFLTILGPSGCGKSTLLHIVGGFESATAGEVRVHGRSVTKPGRDRGMVFQQATLFPWKSVLDNVAWSYRVDKVAKREARERARSLVALVGLEEFADAFPGELSGGMRQRAALARTLALEPEVLLMDEPFGALDAQTREVMQEELNRIWQASGITVVFITHDIYEAVFLGDRVAVMSARPGRIVECVPIELDRPRSGEVKKSARVLEYHNRFWDALRHDAGP
jgi:NitT/TauT family transport system ATP-binding protein